MACWARRAALLVLALVSVWSISREYGRVLPEHGLWDFGAFVASGRAAAEGLNPYGIYPPLTPHVRFPGFEAWNPNLNPPISALLFQLFDLAEPAATLRVWWAISIVSYGMAVLLLVRRYAQGLEAAAIALWAFALAGFWDTLYLGQIYLPLVTIATAGWLLLERRHYVWSGIMIGLLVALKPNFLVWPGLLFLAGHRRPAIAAIATSALISAVPLATYGPEIYRQWLELVLMDGERAFFLTNASLSGLAARMGVPVLGAILSAVLLIGLAIWAFRHRPAALSASGLGLLASLLASPLGWVHYTLFLLPVLLHHWRRMPVWIVALLLTIPVPFVLAQFGASAWIQSTVGSIYGWALLLLLATLIYSEINGRASSAVPAS